MGFLATPFLAYGKHWQTQRKLLNQFLSEKKIHEYHPIQLQAAHSLLRQLLSNPDDHRAAAGRYVILSSATCQAKDVVMKGLLSMLL
jgi:cytochrome P450